MPPFYRNVSFRGIRRTLFEPTHRKLPHFAGKVILSMPHLADLSFLTKTDFLCPPPSKCLISGYTAYIIRAHSLEIVPFRWEGYIVCAPSGEFIIFNKNRFFHAPFYRNVSFRGIRRILHEPIHRNVSFRGIRRTLYVSFIENCPLLVGTLYSLCASG